MKKLPENTLISPTNGHELTPKWTVIGIVKGSFSFYCSDCLLEFEKFVFSDLLNLNDGIQLLPSLLHATALDKY